MKKLFFLSLILLFSLSSYVWATPVDFATDLSNSSVNLEARTLFGSPTLKATLAPSLLDTTFTLDDGETHSFDFFEFEVVDAWGVAGWGDFTIEATLAFSAPDEADVTGNGSGFWGTGVLPLIGQVSGGFLLGSTCPVPLPFWMGMN